MTESPNANGERLGEEGFAKMAMQHIKEKTDGDFVRAVMKDFFTYAPPPPPDDVTVVFLHRKDGA